MFCKENQFKERIKELVRQGVIVSRSLIKSTSTMDQVEGECDEVLLGANQLYETAGTCEGLEETNVSDELLLEAGQLYETTSTSEGQEETHVSVELLLEASQVNSNHDEGFVEVTEKSIFFEAS